MATSLIAQIQQDDPEFDPLRSALEASAISRGQFTAAFDRVVSDGNFGPISAQDWREGDGRSPDTVAEALRVLGQVSEEIDDYRVRDLEFCTGPDDLHGDELAACEGHTSEYIGVSAADLRNEVFAEVRRIYGRLPF